MLESCILGLGGFLTFSFLRYYRFVFYDLARQSVGLLDIIIRDESEDQKLPRIELGTKNLIITLLKSLVLLSISSGVLILWSLVLRDLFKVEELGSIYGIVGFSIGATVPFLIPIHSNSSYNEISKLFHRLVLDHPSLGLKLLKREIKKQSVQLKNKDKFLVVSGLARSGTTSLMNAIFESGSFASLSYSNMPFLLSPRSWKKLYRPGTENSAERSHKDGILINLESNEALEEYFFKAITSDSFIEKKTLNEHSISKKDYNLYLNYQKLIFNKSNKFYLSKNNNMLLRYRSIRKFNEDFIFIVLFRDPLSHAASLLRMHKKFSNQQAIDPFVLEYMNWLGHHEFGENIKPFNFGQNIPDGDKESLDFWLKSWINYYSYASNITDKNMYYICYETYCMNPNMILDKVLVKFQSARKKNYQSYEKSSDLNGRKSAELLDKANSIYSKLKNRQFQ